MSAILPRGELAHSFFDHTPLCTPTLEEITAPSCLRSLFGGGGWRFPDKSYRKHPCADNGPLINMSSFRSTASLVDFLNITVACVVSLNLVLQRGYLCSVHDMFRED